MQAFIFDDDAERRARVNRAFQCYDQRTALFGCSALYNTSLQRLPDVILVGSSARAWEFSDRARDHVNMISHLDIPVIVYRGVSHGSSGYGLTTCFTSQHITCTNRDAFIPLLELERQLRGSSS